MTFNRKLRYAAALVVAVGATVFSLAGSSGAAASGTITYAEAPGAAPNWIFPYTGYLNFSASNINDFQQLMYRPLYFFGLGKTSAYVPSLSLAGTPVLSNSNRTVTINLKGWKFADGQPIDAQSVMFFLNLYDADPTGYGAYTPGAGIPDELASASGSGLTVVLHMKAMVNPQWFLYNYLSEITPLPDRWDMTSAHSAGRCAEGTFGAASTKATCKAVEAYLDKLASTTSTFTTAFWQGGDDGPWKLFRFDAAGDATFEANPSYAGPQRAQVRYFKEIAYSSESQEKSDLQSGKVDVGYIDSSDLTQPAPKPDTPGANLGSLNAKYRLSVEVPYSFDFAQMNFSSSNPLQPEFQQLYIRQALEDSIDQASIVRTVDDNYGVTEDSPMPLTAPTSFGRQPTNPNPFNLTAAKALLTSHGWTNESGVMTCTSPGTSATHCGANIASGAQLKFTLLYVTGDPTVDGTVNTISTDWNAIGVAVTATANTLNNLSTECTSTSATQWSICWSGDNWTYEPNYYPSGEQMFVSGASANAGGYDDTQMNALVAADTRGKSTLSAFEQYAADQLPVLYLPTQESIIETSRSLKSTVGWVPNALGTLLPEYLHF
ncbi:MAG TPA: ABC transporter substrate-binding protein [Acidimicrobiales bacterium]|jgi:peptide/nickel transport system substrate-binding protein|nr:ABC transporter substrate-binding protein [Acidimicrobiales bacterium]